MRKYNERQAITNLQRYLRQLSYTEPDILPVPIDGIFDDATRSALIAFQQREGLEGSGVADRDTWDLLYLRYLGSLESNAVPKGFSPFFRVPKDEALSLGDEHFAVSAAQFMLGELSVINDALPVLEITGVYDAPTERAVTIFQRSAPLEVTGKIDLATWNALVDAYERYGIDYIQ